MDMQEEHEEEHQEPGSDEQEPSGPP